MPADFLAILTKASHARAWTVGCSGLKIGILILVTSTFSPILTGKLGTAGATSGTETTSNLE